MDTDLVATFCGVTGASSHIAEYYLQACEFDLERSIGFFYENPPGPDAVNRAADMDVEEVGEEVAPAPRMASGYQVTPPDDDDELAQAIAASLNQSAPAGTGRPRPSRPTHTYFPDDDDDDVEILARQRRVRQAASTDPFEEMDRMRRDVMATANRLMSEHDPDLFPAMPLPPSEPFHVHEDPLPSRPVGGPSSYSPAEELPTELHGMSVAEVEEARMLEAALLGLPYEGRMPDFSQRFTPSVETTDPDVWENREMRREQDDAYEQSLRADRAKAAAAEKLRHEAEEQARKLEEEARKREAELAEAARREAEAAAALQATLTSKQSRLPPEPPTGDPTSVNVRITMRDGTKLSRRFRKSDALHALFDFVDVTTGGSSVKLHGYNLVVQFPRRVFTEEMGGSFEEHGLTTDTALLIDPKAV